MPKRRINWCKKTPQRGPLRLGVRGFHSYFFRGTTADPKRVLAPAKPSEANVRSIQDRTASLVDGHSAEFADHFPVICSGVPAGDERISDAQPALWCLLEIV